MESDAARWRNATDGVPSGALERPGSVRAGAIHRHIHRPFGDAWVHQVHQDGAAEVGKARLSSLK